MHRRSLPWPPHSRWPCFPRSKRPPRLLALLLLVALGLVTSPLFRPQRAKPQGSHDTHRPEGSPDSSPDIMGPQESRVSSPEVLGLAGTRRGVPEDSSPAHVAHSSASQESIASGAPEPTAASSLPSEAQEAVASVLARPSVSALQRAAPEPSLPLSLPTFPPPHPHSLHRHQPYSTQAQSQGEQPDSHPSNPSSSHLPYPFPEARLTGPLDSSSLATHALPTHMFSLDRLPTEPRSANTLLSHTLPTHSSPESSHSVFPHTTSAAENALLLPDPFTSATSSSASLDHDPISHRPPLLHPTTTAVLPAPNLDPTGNSRPASLHSPVNIFFRGEFGYELIAALPVAYWHHLNGSLNSTRFCAMPSLALLYFFSPIQTVGWKCKRSAHFNYVIKRYGFKEGLHDSDIPERWTPPPLASHIRGLGPVWTDVPAGAPLVVISNKFETEWGEPPVNFIDIRTLKRIVTEFLNSGYYVVYNRAGKAFRTDREQRDLTSLGEYRMFRQEFRLETRFTTMHKLLRRNCHNCDYNEVQFRMMARSSCFVSVQGGTSVLSSYWGGRNIIYFRRGAEEAGGAYERIYPKLSGCQIDVVKSYDALTNKVAEMIHEGKCQAV
ncbi:hypothetical protein CLOM_g22510 [Closterium sp. NIES-68]|nr:hypothetical protein CLOM_g22510 [Closterium sp. NIES-68]GJP59480.1 hypothetical protein CLOP_g12268 [Closterium sp. NIES-67]